jgi:putative methionine-R-sulfoxide reductase with GAF domain
MDKYTIFDQATTGVGVAPQRREPIADAAQRDMEAALQLLAERAQYLTGASGASIGLREGGEMVCRAGAGRVAPTPGAEIEADSGLTAESIRTRQLVRCDNVEDDSRVNRESCRELGVKSAMVMPLLREQEVVGVFELVADRESAFEESDVAVLMRLAEMALTVVEYADAAQRALPEISEAERDQGVCEKLVTVEPAKPIEKDQISSIAEEPLPLVSAEISQIGSCESCGFPVSQGRTLCVDCEHAGRSAEGKPRGGDASAFSHLSAMGREETWFQAHSYTLGALLVAALTIALLALKLR